MFYMYNQIKSNDTALQEYNSSYGRNYFIQPHDRREYKHEMHDVTVRRVCTTVRTLGGVEVVAPDGVALFVFADHLHLAHDHGGDVGAMTSRCTFNNAHRRCGHLKLKH